MTSFPEVNGIDLTLAGNGRIEKTDDAAYYLVIAVIVVPIVVLLMLLMPFFERVMQVNGG